MEDSEEMKAKINAAMKNKIELQGTIRSVQFDYKNVNNNIANCLRVALPLFCINDHEKSICCKGCPEGWLKIPDIEVNHFQSAILKEIGVTIKELEDTHYGFKIILEPINDYINWQNDYREWVSKAIFEL